MKSPAAQISRPKRIGFSLLSFLLIVSGLSVINVPQVKAATQTSVTATGTNPSICNQTGTNLGEPGDVTAERLSGGECVVKFLAVSSSYSWTVPAGVTSVSVLVVGGGGGGGSRHSGGGGGGGVMHLTNYRVTSGNYSVTVGAGGTGYIGGTTPGGGNAGASSNFGGSAGAGSVVANGGGGGGGGDSMANQLDFLGTTNSTPYPRRGSGGGSNWQSHAAGSGAPGSVSDTPFAHGASQSATINSATATVNSYGKSGAVGLGSGCKTSGNLPGWCGGGGGGASAAGSSPAVSSGYRYIAGSGGAGQSINISGTATTYAGGGGGGAGDDTNPIASNNLCLSSGPLAGNGGAGGGGNGGQCLNDAISGTANTGGGGGGGGFAYVTGFAQNAKGGNGGSGIVIISYTLATLVVDLDAANAASYPGSGTTWTNLVNNGNFTISNGSYSDSNGGAIVFNGSSTFVSLATPLSSGDSFTKEAWVKDTKGSGDRNILSSASNVLFLSGTTLYGGVNGGYSIVSSTNFPTNEWVHVVLSFSDSANIMSLYINGTRVSQNTNVTASYPQQIERIGSHVSGSTPVSFWQGSIAKVRIYNSALNDDEVVSRYDATKGAYVLNSALTPTFGTPTATADGFTVSITNYDADFTWATPTVSAGSVAVTSTTGSTRVLTVTGLSAGASATITQNTSRTGYSNGTQTVSGTASTGAALTPAFGSTTATADGFTVQISNYSGSYDWAGTATASGSVAISGTGLVTVTGVAAGTSSTATITTTRTGYTGGSATVSATSSTGAALNPTFGSATATADGFTVQISNYSASYTWAGTATASGSVAISGTGLVTVTGVAPATSSTATITTTRTGYTSGSATVSATSSTGTALTPGFGSTTATADGFTVQISNYSASYTWAGTATASGSVAISGTGLVTVTGVAAGTASTATITTTRTGYTGGTATVSATSLGNFVTTYDATTNGGTAISPLTVSFTEGGTALTLPTPATRTGFTPSGWYTTASSGGSKVGDAEAAYTPSATATLYFRWTANTYTVTYDANTGGGSMSTQSITAGTSFQLSNNAFTKSNFTFDGWYINAESTGTRYNAGQSVTLYGNQTYFAKWSATPRYITYAANGGTGSVPTESSKSTGGTFLVAAGTGLSRTGYDFAGWSDGSSTVAAGSTYTVPSGNVTLTAQWTAQTYTITYNGNNSTSGDPSRTSDSFVYGSSAIALPTVGTLARTGYTFAGWSAIANGSALTGNYTPTQSVILYARWSANTYTTSYNTNGGSGTAPSNSTYTTGGAGFALPAGTGLSKTGYDFDGWSTTTTGSALSGTQTSTADQILYARWTLQTITATYAKGTASSSTFTNFPTSASGSYGTTITLDSTVDNSVSISGTTYVFQGWSDGTSTYQTGDTYLLGEGPITLTAQWVAIYGVRYTLNGGTAAAGDFAYDAQCTVGDNYCTNGQVITSNVTPSRTGYEFTGWKDQSNNSIAQAASFTVSSGTFLLYAQWTAIARTVTYALNSGSGSAPTESNKTISQSFSISNTVPNRSGYTFTGWSDGTLVFGPGAQYTVGNSNVTLTAQWSAISYTVTYDTNRGTSTTPTQANRNVAQTFAVASAPTRAGYTFGKWNDGTNDYDPSNTYTMPAANVVLTATWSATSLTITYSVNGGSSTLPTESNKTIGNAFTLAAAATYANRDFLGWNDGSTTYRAGATYTVGSSNVTLTAQWSGTTFSVTYADGGSTGGSVPTEVAKEAGVYVTVKAHTLGSLAKTGYTFAGWSDGSNVYSAGDSYLMNATAVVFTATWNRDAYMVTYVAGGGSGTLPTQSDVAAGGSFTVASGSALSKSNFTFAGWSDGTTTYAAGVSYTNIAIDVTLTAQWTAIANSGSGSGGGSSRPTNGGPSNALNIIVEKVSGGQKVSWNNSSAVTIIVKSFNGAQTKYENVNNSLEIPNPKPGESKEIVITNPSQPDQILETKTIYQAPLAAQNLTVKQMTNRSLQIAWKPSSTVVGYRVVITPTVGAPVIVDTTDPKFAVQTAPGQKYTFEVIAIGAGGLESGTISRSASLSTGKVVTPLLEVAQTIKTKAFTQSTKDKLADFAETIAADSSILCTGSASSKSGRASALAAASRACATLQQANPEIFVKPVVKIVSTKKNPKLAKSYTVGISVVIKPIG